MENNLPPSVYDQAQDKYNAMIEDAAARIIKQMLGDEEAQQLMGKVVLLFKQLSNTNPQIRACTPASISRAMAMAAMTGLSVMPIAPEAYILPRRNNKNNGAMELNFQPSWRGWKKIADAQGIKMLPYLVYEGDEFELEYGTTPKLMHKPKFLSSGYDKVQFAYVVAHYPDGEPQYVVMSKAQIEKRRKLAGSDVFWNNWTEEMALKTAIHYAVSRGLIPIQFGTKMSSVWAEVAKSDMEDTGGVIDGEYETVIETPETVSETHQIAETLQTETVVDQAVKEQTKPKSASERAKSLFPEKEKEVEREPGQEG